MIDPYQEYRGIHPIFKKPYRAYQVITTLGQQFHGLAGILPHGDTGYCIFLFRSALALRV